MRGKNSKKTMNILHVTDLHLLHADTPVENTLQGLSYAIFDNTDIALLDAIVVSGDVWDHQNTADNPKLLLVNAWVCSLLRLCKKHDISLWFLEGTPLHDWKQSRIFVQLNEETGIGADMVYIDTLSIVYFPKHDVNVLFIPDEIRPSTDITKRDVIAMMKEQNLEFVDFTIVHGFVTCQLPPKARVPGKYHDQEFYESITKYLIMGGHVHQMKVDGKFSTPGSFDRHTHGDEAPKGYMRYTIRDHGAHTINFIENRTAKKYVTVDVTGFENVDAIQTIHQKMESVPKGSAIRVIAAASDSIVQGFHNFALANGAYTWKLEKSVNKVLEHKQRADVVSKWRNTTLTKTTLCHMVLERIADQHPELYDECSIRLKEACDAID